ncbi:MAG TPA: adenylate/guanylate cyclase domain-containing protein [Myxococcales bacterium]|jgi:class 3 adenylate cyclase|nr:adenylate/guanylate cyclase domain-containing protein [Myxococcales bacterium]
MADEESPQLEDLLHLFQLNREVDDSLEESLKARENLAQTFRRLFPRLLQRTGAAAVAVTTRGEDLVEETYVGGAWGQRFPGDVLREHPAGVARVPEGTLVSQPLDVAGVKVGTMGLLFEGDRTARREAGRLGRILDVVAEELDTVLISIHTAAEKHQLIVQFNQLLSNPVFEVGMDQAVLTLAQRVRLPGFLLVYRDAVQPGLLHYRVYRHGHLHQHSREQPHPQLDELIRRRGVELVHAENQELKDVTGNPGKSVEAVLIAGAANVEPLGKILVWSETDGFSAFTMDLVRVMASTLTQRLLDYNRERIHLSQFFSAGVIDELLRDPRYAQKYLTPRDEEVGILFADINSFTRICEVVLESPARIGRFVDRWSDAAVRVLWKHGGVFDKMVGDCVIGLFGPPFFRAGRVERAEAAVRAACEIQQLTQAMSSDPEVARLSELVKLPGLGVAIGVNLAHTYCGIFGPNQQYTGFSTGMNSTARLQSLGGFREILVMESVKQALQSSADASLRELSYGELTETPVKNVAHPLRHHRLLLPK